MRTIHVIGAGLAGLAAALALSEKAPGGNGGLHLVLHEAGPQAGGRCRSYHDRELGLLLDNGNHLVLSGNGAVRRYLAMAGSQNGLASPPGPIYPFFERDSGLRYEIRFSTGRFPFWLFDPRRRVPDTRARDYAALARLLRAGEETVLGALPWPEPLYRRLIEPLAIAVLNTDPGEASALLFRRVLAETLLKGGRALIPAFPPHGLGPCFIEPALATLTARGAEIRLNQRIAALRLEGNRVAALRTGRGEEIALSAADGVVLAVPPWVAAELLPGLPVPERFESILNIHYRMEAPRGEAGFWGILGGLAQWVFVKEGVVSVTVSAANATLEEPAEALAERAFADITALFARPPGPLPPYRVIREKRATFAATPENERRRPGPRVGLANLALAGDWTATGLPATIEGAIRSGFTAAEVLHAA
jgi:squalene-associated FAD-dependent desaturase